MLRLDFYHIQDATPITIGQEFSAYTTQIERASENVKYALKGLLKLPQGGTAVGTGINTPPNFAKNVVDAINSELHLTNEFQFAPADNKFAQIAAHDDLLHMQNVLSTLSATLCKIANDIRLLGSGPRCGLGELILPSNEPGSSIMPGKVNPTQVEALTSVAYRVIGNSTACALGAAHGHLQLNAYKPLIGATLLESIVLLGQAVDSFARKCVHGLQVNKAKVSSNLESSLMLVTALNPKIGYDGMPDFNLLTLFSRSQSSQTGT